MKQLFVLSLCLLSIFPAKAINLQGYRFSDSYRFAIMDDSLKDKFAGDYVLTSSLAYIKSPFYVTDQNISTKRSDIIKYSYVGTLGFSYYLTTNFSLGADLNVVHNKIFNEKKTSLADSVLKAKWNVYRSEDFSVALNPQVYVPTGKLSNFTTMDSVGGALNLIGEYSFNRFHILGSVGYFYAKNNQFQIVDYRSIVLSQLGLSYDINDFWNINLEANRNFTMAKDKHQDEGDYYLVAKNKTTESLSSYFGVGVAGLDKVDRHNYTAFVGIKFSEPAGKKIIETPPPVVEKPVFVEKVVVAPKKIQKRSDESQFGVLQKAENIYFDNAKSNLMNSEKNKLIEFAEVYSKMSTRITHIVIEGYASRVGNTKQNKILGTRRAESVRDYLVSQGVPETKLSLVSYGDETSQDKEEWKNRKVQFRVYRN